MNVWVMKREYNITQHVYAVVAYGERLIGILGIFSLWKFLNFDLKRKTNKTNAHRVKDYTFSGYLSFEKYFERAKVKQSLKRKFKRVCQNSLQSNLNNPAFPFPLPVSLFLSFHISNAVVLLNYCCLINHCFCFVYCIFKEVLPMFV